MNPSFPPKRLPAVAALGLVAVLTAAGVGCSESSLIRVKGKVTLDGAPLDGATIVLVSTTGASRDRSTAVSGADGTFEVRTGRAEGAPPGPYKVLVSKMVPAEGESTNPQERKAKQKGEGIATLKQQNSVPDAYNAANTTPFTLTVPPAGAVSFDLKSGGP